MIFPEKRTTRPITDLIKYTKVKCRNILFHCRGTQCVLLRLTVETQLWSSRKTAALGALLQPDHNHAGVSLEAKCFSGRGGVWVRRVAAADNSQGTRAASGARAGRHRGGSPVLLSRQCSVPKLSDRRIGRPQSDLSDLFRPAVSQGARETPWEEGSFTSTDEPGDADFRGAGAGRVAPGNIISSGSFCPRNRSIQGVHAAVPRRAGQASVRPGLPRGRHAKQALDALQQAQVYGEGDAVTSFACLPV